MSQSGVGASQLPVSPATRFKRTVPCLLLGLLLVTWCPSATYLNPSVNSPGTLPRAFGHHPVKTGFSQQDRVFAALDDDRAWACLPPRVRRAEGGLPVWARTLAKSLPRTTAAMLELDYAHRATSSLDPKLRGQIRWEAARALHCEYGEAYALYDLRRASVGENEIQWLLHEPQRLPPEVRKVLGFVRRLSRAAYAITDEEVAELTATHGEKQVVAMVFCVAYANFLDRLALALDVSVEPGGPLPPLDVRFVRRMFASEPSPGRARPLQPDLAVAGVSGLKDPDWKPQDLAEIQNGMHGQKARQSRISLPNTDPTLNRWGLVGQTYQTALASAWSVCTQAFGEESDQDPIFEQSIFWIVTRTKQCFY